MRGQNGVKVDLQAWLPLLGAYRLATHNQDTLLFGSLRPDLTPESPEVVAALDQWPAAAHFRTDHDGTEVVLVCQLEAEPRSWPIVHVLLLLATIVTTLGSGALMRDVDPFATRFLDLGSWSLPYPTRIDFGRLWRGASFAVPFLTVLLTHEMGHYLAARRHRVRASLPYFLPFPPYLSVIGTLGAFIRLKGPTVRRSILFDIGASGPVASLVLSLPMFIVGLTMSEAVPGPSSLATPFLIRFTGQNVWLGNGILTHVLGSVFGPVPVGEELILLHPVALAGWLGLFVTALNLLPLGQLDGGHILYSLFPEGHKRVARLFLLSLIPLGFAWWGWWGWGLLVLVVHRGQVVHPSVVLPEARMTPAREALGWFLFLTFLLTLTPVPISL
jgi:Zn-dependent protease